MDCKAVAASCSTCIASSPECFQAVYGMPSGPGAEWPEILIALVMSLRRILQSSAEVGKLGRVWFFLGASVHRLAWSCGMFANDAFALVSLFCVLVRGRWLVELSEESGDALRDVDVEGGRERGRGGLKERGLRVALVLS